MSDVSDNLGNSRNLKLSTKLKLPSHPLVVISRMLSIVVTVACITMRLRTANSLAKANAASATDSAIRLMIAT